MLQTQMPLCYKNSRMWHESFNEILENSYEKLKTRNARFSRRAFAKKIGVSSGMLSDVANGKARFTKERAMEILTHLDLLPKEIARMRVLLGKSNEFTQEIPASEKFMVLYEWQYRAILFAFDLEKFEVTPELLSEKLGLPIVDVEKRIQTLLDIGLLDRIDGKVIRTKVIWRVPEETTKEFVHKLYENNLDLAKKAIKQIPATERDYTTITFAGNTAQLENLRKEIQALYEKTFAIMEKPNTDEVYQMSVFLHPLLKPGLK